MTTLDYSPALFEQPQARRHSSGFFPSVIYLVLSLLGMMLVGNQTTGDRPVILVGTLSSLMLCFCVWRRYRGRWELNAELTFLLGTGIQFLFASVFFRLLIPESPSYRLMGGSAERLDAKNYWVQGILIVSAFLGAFLATSAMVPLPKSRRLLDGRLSLIFTKRSLVIMAAFGINLWLIRSMLLSSGSFYHTYRSSFQDDDWRYQAWTQYDTGVGPVLVAYLWAAAFAGNLGYPLAIGYTFVDTFWNFLTGARQKTLAPLVAIVLTYIIYRRKIPWKGMLLSVIPLLLLMGFMDQYRQVLHNYVEVNKINWSAVTKALTVASDRTERLGPVETALSALARLTELDSVSRIYQGVPSEMDYLDGQSYAKIPIAFIPRQLWPDKPIINMKINDYFFRHEGGQSPTTVMGEGYMNFAWLGVICSGIAAALLIRSCDWLIRLMLSPTAMLPVYIGFLAILERMACSTLAIWTTSFAKVLLFSLIVWVCSTRLGAKADDMFAAQDASQ